MAELEKLVNVLKAAGELTRLRLLALLRAGELSVKDLTDILGQSQPRVSRHLGLLVQAGLVDRNAEGAWAYFRVVDTGEEGAFLQTLLAQIDPEDEIFLRDRRALEKIRRRHQREAEAYFSKVAHSWDSLRKLHVPESAVEDAILRHVGAGRVSQMLDLGTGTGRMLELLAGRYERGLGVDASREMLGVARAKLAGAGISHARVRLGDISRNDRTMPEADLIVLHQVLHYFDDPGRVLARAADWLAADGRMLVVDFAPHGHEFLRERDAHRRLGLSREQMEAWATGGGLKVDHFEEFANESVSEGLVVCLWMLSRKRGSS